MSDNVIRLLGMGEDPRQWAWSACMSPADHFKFPASHPRLSMLEQGIKEIFASKRWDDDDIRALVRSLTQRVIWITLENTDLGLKVSFGTKDDEGGDYSYSVTVREPARTRKAKKGARSG